MLKNRDQSSVGSKSLPHPARGAVILADLIMTMPRRTGTGVAYLLPLAPLALLAWPLYCHVPGVTADAGNILGFGAVLCLLACLAVTPAAVLTGMRKASRWRRHYGLCVFALGLAGLVIAVTSQGMAPGGMPGQAAGHVREWTGTVIVVLLIPLTLTSSTLAQKMLGAHWKTWQRRLTWAVWAAITVHLLILSRNGATTAWLLASVPLLIARIPAVRADITRWRRSGYADTHLWILTGMAFTAFAAGAGILLAMEVAAIAGLYRAA